ncbi:MAG: hypothetical protein P9L91_09695 [Candidatus Zophobacter franzmannii]|nr:hypothetical protein [Candidatus Zophobacter franzmannii]
MKVKFVSCVSGISGKMEEFVFCVDKKTGVVWMREYVKPEITEHNHQIGSIAQNISLFKDTVSEGYLEDLKDYADRHNLATIGLPGKMNGYTALMKMLYALKRAMPDVDLLTLTPQEVIDSDLPIKTIREAIDNGILPFIQRYTTLDAWII